MQRLAVECDMLSKLRFTIFRTMLKRINWTLWTQKQQLGVDRISDNVIWSIIEQSNISCFYFRIDSISLCMKINTDMINYVIAIMPKHTLTLHAIILLLLSLLLRTFWNFLCTPLTLLIRSISLLNILIYCSRLFELWHFSDKNQHWFLILCCCLHINFVRHIH